MFLVVESYAMMLDQIAIICEFKSGEKKLSNPAMILSWLLINGWLLHSYTSLQFLKLTSAIRISRLLFRTRVEFSWCEWCDVNDAWVLPTLAICSEAACRPKSASNNRCRYVDEAVVHEVLRDLGTGARPSWPDRLPVSDQSPDRLRLLDPTCLPSYPPASPPVHRRQPDAGRCRQHTQTLAALLPALLKRIPVPELL